MKSLGAVSQAEQGREGEKSIGARGEQGVTSIPLLFSLQLGQVYFPHTLGRRISDKECEVLAQALMCDSLTDNSFRLSVSVSLSSHAAHISQISERLS